MKRIIGISVCMMMLILSGCSTFDSFNQEFVDKSDNASEVVSIGVFEPLTGSDKTGAESEIRGIELAHSMYPTIDGKKVELIYADNRSDINVAETAITDLIEQRPKLILGSYGDTNSLVASEYIDRAQIPSIAVTNTNPLITSTSDYYFRICFVDTYQGTAFAKYVYYAKKAEKAAVMVDQSSEQYAAIAQKFVSVFTALSDSDEFAAETVTFESGGKDYSEELEKIRKLDVRYVFLPASQEDAEVIVSQAYAKKLDVEFLGVDSWNPDELVSSIGSVSASRVSLVKVSDIELAYSDSTQVQDFLECYASMYGDAQAPDSAVALGFDAYMLAIKAIGEAGSDSSGTEIKDAVLAQKDFQGVSGTFSFDKSGNPQKSVTIYTINPYTGESVPSWIIETDGQVTRVEN